MRADLGKVDEPELASIDHAGQDELPARGKGRSATPAANALGREAQAGHPPRLVLGDATIGLLVRLGDVLIAGPPKNRPKGALNCRFTALERTLGHGPVEGVELTL
jgi:hypothetical protein